MPKLAGATRKRGAGAHNKLGIKPTTLSQRKIHFFARRSGNIPLAKVAHDPHNFCRSIAVAVHYLQPLSNRILVSEKRAGKGFVNYRDVA